MTICERTLSKLKYLDRKNILYLKSPKKGKNVCILAGVHGNEIAGINAIRRIMSYKNFKIDNGTVCMLLCNKKAMKLNRRFVDENLNRCFMKRKKTGTYEERIAEEMKKIMREADILLDIHNSTSPKSEQFSISERNARHLLDAIDVKKHIFGFDALEPGGTDYYVNKLGKIGLTVESGYLKDKTSIDFAYRLIIKFLIKTGNITGKYKRSNKKELYQLTKVYIPKNDFRISKKFADFERVKKGQTIGFDGTNRIKAEYDCHVLFAWNIDKKKNRNGEAFLLIKRIKN